MELCSIASGSSGNCICVGSDDCHVLIDAGISGKKVEAGLNSLGMKTEEMKGILVTHEHTDHIAGLGVVARRYGIPIYATRGTIDAILHTKSVGKVDEALFCEVTPGTEFTIGDLEIEPIPISHDAADPVAYKIRHEDRTAAVVTDLGTYDEKIIEKIRKVRGPSAPQELGLSREDFRDAVLYAKDMRYRYSLLQLIWDIGKEEEYASEVTDYFYSSL